MPLNVLFAAKPERWSDYALHLRDAFAEVGVDADLSETHDPAVVDYIVYAPNGALQDFAPFTRCKAVLSLWAGVEGIVGNQSLTQPLCKMVDPALTQGMVEWVTGHALRHHLGMDAHITATPGNWEPTAPPVAWERKITVLGLGELGAACADSLRRIGFDVHGWARSSKALEGITCHHGADGLHSALQDAQGVVLLLPATPQTDNTLNAQAFAMLAPGAFVLNPGRGPLIDEDALLAALDAGQVGHATLDTFRVEPLPVQHPFWHHPRVTVTPHIASETRPLWSSKTIAQNIRRCEDGDPLLHRVDRTRGY